MAINGNDLRRRLDADETILLPGVWDALSAQLAHDGGLPAAFLSGYALSGTLLGLPDIGYLTQIEVADAARRIVAAVPDLMLVVDGDTGYGSALNTKRTVELWERAGAAGIFLEDQVFPKRCGHMAGKEVVPVDTWLANLRAALAHRSDLFIVARTDARTTGGLDEAIHRARLAGQLGVDALFVEAPESVEELKAIGEALGGQTLVANMVESGRTPLLSPDELAALGFSLIVSPVSALFAMTSALRDVYGRLADTGTLRDDLSALVTFDEFAQVTRLDTHRQWELDAES